MGGNFVNFSNISIGPILFSADQQTKRKIGSFFVSAFWSKLAIRWGLHQPEKIDGGYLDILWEGDCNHGTLALKFEQELN